MIDAKALEAVARAMLTTKMPDGCTIEEYIGDIVPGDAINLGVNLSEKDANGKPRFHWYSDIRGDEYDEVHMVLMRTLARAAIEAYLRALPASGGEGVAVKPLEWREPYIGAKGYISVEARSVVSRYEVYCAGAGLSWAAEADNKPIGVFDTEAFAKAAAQADYEARIRSALSLQQGEVERQIIHELAADIRDRLSHEEGSANWRNAQRIVELSRPRAVATPQHGSEP